MGKVKEMLLAQEEEKYEQLSIFDFIDEEEDEPEDDWEAYKKEEQLSEQNDEDDDDDYELTQEDWDRIEYLCSKED